MNSRVEGANHIEIGNRRLPYTEVGINHPHNILGTINERLAVDSGTYFVAGVLNPIDKDPQLDPHYLFIAPATPIWDPNQLTVFTQGLVKDLGVRIKNARIEHGSLTLPDFYVHQHVGNRAITTVTEVVRGSFQDQGEGAVVLEQTIPLIQRIVVKVYPDQRCAENRFAYAQALMSKKDPRYRVDPDHYDFREHILRKEDVRKYQRFYEKPNYLLEPQESE